MPAYLVRIIDSQDLVGIFFASNVTQLMVTVDECCDPGDCEYASLGVGGIMWTRPAIPVPIELPEDVDDASFEVDALPWGAATMTEVWWNHFYGLSNLAWRPICGDRPSEPFEPDPPRPAGPGHIVPLRKPRS